MKKSKRLMGLLVILGAVCAAAYGITRYEEEKERIKNSDEIPDVSEPEEILFAGAEESRIFYKKNSANT